MISSCHCCAADFAETDWETILSIYDRLLMTDSSPVVCLNRAVALAKVWGAGPALAELEKPEVAGALKTYYLYYSVKADLLEELGQYGAAAEALKAAIELAPLSAEKAFLQNKLAGCQK